MTLEEKEVLINSLKREVLEMPAEGLIKVNYGKKKH